MMNSKKNISIALFLLSFIFVPKHLNAQENYYNDYIINEKNIQRQDYDAFDENGQPLNRTKQVAFVYLDFPDGRVPGSLKIPENNTELASVIHRDAVGEIGLTSTPSPFPSSNPNLYANVFKYKWSDRWNMLFSTGIYQGSAHPDNLSHYGYTALSKEAYGSFKEYFTEISNSKFTVIPALTHSDQTETMYRTGIVNNIKTLANGDKVIESIMLPLQKYHPTDPNIGYFPDHTRLNYTEDPNLQRQRMELMMADAYAKLVQLHNNQSLEFDVNSFLNNGGIIVYVTAGSHQKFKGIGMGTETIVRGMFDQISSEYAVIDGITCMSHEFAHLALGWQHTVAGRNCLMNPNQTKDINCPSHPNPILKLREGWVTPIQLSSNLNNIILQPVESSKQVGIITIYGNPSAAPDHLSGECYVVENRKRLGFDKKLLSDDPVSSPYKGGLLVWHYGPYGEFDMPPDAGLEAHAYKLVTPNNIDPLSIILSQGNEEYFFAFKNVPAPPEFYNLLQNRTYSQEILKTGIQIENIHQADYNNESSNIIFNLSYNISLPPQYDYTVINYTSQTGNNLVSTSGRIYFHKANNYDYFRLYPGAKIDVAPNTAFSIKGIKATGERTNKIVFSSPGYENINESYFCKYNGMVSYYLNTFDDVDGVIFKNIYFTNVNDNKNKIGMTFSVSSIKYPVEIENITTDNPCTDKSVFDINLVGALINKVNVNGVSTKFVQIQTTPQCNINMLNTYAGFYATNSFASDGNVAFKNCIVNGSSTILKAVDGNIWQGITLTGGGINFSGVTIKGATNGLNLNGLNRDLKISNCTFDNLNQDLTINGYIFDNTADNGRVHDNLFDPNGNNAPIHIWVLNTNTISIENNNMPHTKWTGIALFNCIMPSVKNNTIQGVNAAQEVGISSYSSGGVFNCNTISHCYEGIELDNSQPLLYQNNINTNGIGMFLTNNSYPIMSPAYLSGETNNLAGYNHFYNNSGHEIYIFNTENAKNNLLMDDGFNIVEDNVNSEYYLIYIENQGWTPSEVIECKNNYWGEIPNPGDKLYPVEYFNYTPFLYSPPTPSTTCQYSTVSEDNSSKSQQTLLMGNALTSGLNGDYVNASNYSQQLTTLEGNQAIQKAGSRLYYTNKYLDGSGISSLPAYYENLISANSNDTLLKRYYRGLKIESKVINTELQSALINLDSIISNPLNPYELLYANIDKLRILSMLDSTSGGDNNGMGNNNIGLPELCNLLKSSFNKITGSSELSSESKISNNKRTNSKKADLSKYDFLLKKIPNNLDDLNGMSYNQIKEVIKDKIMYEILTHNYVIGVPPIRSDEYKFKHKTDVDNILPKVYTLSQNYPNPFNPSTTIKYALPKDNMVSLKIYDVTGREIKTLVNDVKKAGYYSITFSVSDLSSGIYFYRIQAGNFVQTKRMVLIK